MPCLNFFLGKDVDQHFSGLTCKRRKLEAVMLEVMTTLTSKFFLIYIGGVIIILLYAKDKFNTPTYDRNAMGPFAQLPPQFLTIDARYRRGRAAYIVLMLCVYTAICIVGPASFSNVMAAAEGISGAVPSGGNDEVWPVAAATFLISSGTASDNSILGRVELFIRQYAHKTAYIPSAVSDLAFSLRSLNISQWLISNPYVDKNELNERKRALTALVGEPKIAQIEQRPEQEGEVAAWVRANILFYILQQIFAKQKGELGAKLDYLTELDQNKQVFERIQGERERLARQFPPGAQHGDIESGKTFAEVQQFNKEASLMIAVLLSQTARNTNYLKDHLDQLGFQGVDLQDRSDHFTYVTMVNLFIVAGAAVAMLLLVAKLLPRIGAGMTWVSNDVVAGLVTIGTGVVLYLVMFKVLDYSRDRLLDSLDWQENLEGYVKVATTASVLSCIVSVIVLVLLFSLFKHIDLIANGPVAFAVFVLFQFVVAAVGTSFGLAYMRQAARLPQTHLRWRNMSHPTALVHGAIAATFVAGLNYSNYMYNVRFAPGDALQAISAQWAAIQKGATMLAMPYTEAQRASISQALKRVGAGQQKGGDIKTQIADVISICTILDAPYRSLPARGAPVEGPVPAPPLFVAENSCEVADPAGDEPAQAFARSLDYLYGSLVQLKESEKPQHIVWFFPAVTAFLIAYAFGVGCRHWRAWWLNNDVKRVTEIKEQIRQAYGNTIDVERCLTHPIALLGNVTVIEALRYEDYRAKLYGSVQKRKVVWPEDFDQHPPKAADKEVADQKVVQFG
jgi:hypothetical protein